jgi:hypothetical protein
MADTCARLGENDPGPESEELAVARPFRDPRSARLEAAALQRNCRPRRATDDLSAASTAGKTNSHQRRWPISVLTEAILAQDAPKLGLAVAGTPERPISGANASRGTP